MSDWHESELRELATFNKGRKVEVSDHPRLGFAPYLGAGVLAGGETSAFADTRGAVLASAGDVLMLWDGERSGLVGRGRDGVVSSTVSKLTPKGGVTSRFLYYALDLKFSWIQGRRTGTGVPHVPKDLGRILRVRYPSEEPEQRSICEILSTVDEAIEQTEALIAKTQQIKAGLMHDLFTRGVTLDGQLRPPREEAPQLYKESPLGWIPKEWDVEPARRLCSLITKGTTPPAEGFRTGDRSVRFLRVDNLTFDGGLDLTISPLWIDPQTHHDALRRSIIYPGDVLTNIVGPPLGKVGLVPNAEHDWNANQAVAIFRATAVLPAFMKSWLLTFPAQRWLAREAKQTSGQVNLTLKMCGDLPVPIPAESEQEAMLACLNAADDGAQSEADFLINLKHQKHGLMQDLLTGRVPGAPAVAADV